MQTIIARLPFLGRTLSRDPTKVGQAKYYRWSASMMRFKNMHGLGEHSVETVEVILYKLKPNSHKMAEVICHDGGGYMPRRRRLYAKTAEVVCTHGGGYMQTCI